MILQQPVYYRNFSVRLPSQLTAPRHFPVNRLSLPRNSVLHYFGESETELGPSEDNPFIRKSAKQIFIRHITDLASNVGNPKPNYVQSSPLIQDYRRNHRRLRPLMRWETAARDQQNLVVINYAMLPRMRRYVTSFFRSYYRWYNIFATAVTTVNEIAAVSDRQQFFSLQLNDQMPTVLDLRKAESNINRNSLKAFRDDASLTIMDIWRWLGRNRSSSILSQLDDAAISRVNFVVNYYGEWLVFNLGVLNGWRRSEANPGGLDPKRLQLLFIKMLTVLKDTASELAIRGVDLDKLEAQEQEHADVVAEVEEFVEEDGTNAAEVEDEAIIAEQLDQLEADQSINEDELDLDALAIAEGEEEDEEGVEYQTDEDEEGPGVEQPARSSISKAVGTDELADDTGNAILAKANDLAKRSQITAADYRRLVKLSNIVNEVPDPYGGNQSIVEASVITADDLVLKPTLEIPEIPVIVDQSMRQSTVNDFDTQYIEKVLRKDILQSVLSVQNAGIAVTNYDVEVVQDAVSDYEIHTVTLVPVVGRQSTIRFRVPRVTPEGVYTSNGTNYRMRKQKVD